MNYACPHCHELLPTDAASGLPPAMCTRCGGDIHPPSPEGVEPTVPEASASRSTGAARSLATFLRSKKTEANAVAAPESAREHAPAGPGGDNPEAAQETPSEEVGVLPVQHDTEALEADRADFATATPEALAAEATTLDGASETHGPVQESEAGEPAHPLPDFLDTPESHPAAGASASPAALPASLPEEAASPSFTFAPHASTPALRTPAWQWAALLVLALALVLQVLLADRARLAMDAQWRPLLSSLCGVFGCSLPTWREPDAFTMLSRDVRPAPGTPGALLVQATFRNDARWSQQWPSMKLSLSDADGRVVGARAFTPAEYLEPGVTQSALAPGQSAQVMLQVREPPASVVAFSFDFD